MGRYVVASFIGFSALAALVIIASLISQGSQKFSWFAGTPREVVCELSQAGLSIERGNRRLTYHDNSDIDLGFVLIEDRRRLKAPAARYTRLRVSHWLLLPCALLTGVVSCAAAWHRRPSRAATTQCPRCGYDLRAGHEHCPECGIEVIPVIEVAFPKPLRGPWSPQRAAKRYRRMHGI